LVIVDCFRRHQTILDGCFGKRDESRRFYSIFQDSKDISNSLESEHQKNYDASKNPIPIHVTLPNMQRIAGILCVLIITSANYYHSAHIHSTQFNNLQTIIVCISGRSR
jgi:hypothetical protein